MFLLKVHHLLITLLSQNKILTRTAQALQLETPGASTSTALNLTSSLRPLRSLAHVPATPIQLASPAPSTPGPSNDPSITDQQRIKTLRFGQWDIGTWYDAPFPEEYNNLPEGRLWMCEFCLKYMRSGFGWERHRVRFIHYLPYVL